MSSVACYRRLVVCAEYRGIFTIYALVVVVYCKFLLLLWSLRVSLEALEGKPHVYYGCGEDHRSGFIFRDEVKKTLEVTRDKRSRMRGIPLQCDAPLLLYI